MESKSVTRRDGLRLLGGTLISSISGCANIPRQGTEETETSSSLEFTSKVQKQQSEDSPAQVEVELINQGSETIEAVFGPALLYTDNEGSELRWSTEIILDPDTYVGPWDEPVQTKDGCWRYPDDGRTPVQSSLEEREIDPNKSISETYYIYTVGSDGPCLPQGEYVFQDKGRVSNEGDIIFELELSIGDDMMLTDSEAKVNR